MKKRRKKRHYVAIALGSVLILVALSYFSNVIFVDESTSTKGSSTPSYSSGISMPKQAPSTPIETTTHSETTQQDPNPSFLSIFKEPATDSKSLTLEKPRKTLIELKLGYFFFSDSVMDHVYNRGGESAQIAFSQPIWKNICLYGDAGYAEKHGHSLNAYEPTHIQLTTFSLGFKPVFSFNDDMDFYIALGPRYFFVHAKNSSPYVDQTLSNSGLGAFANTGLQFRFKNGFSLNLFGDYSYMRMLFNSSQADSPATKTQIGGFTVGLGFGYSF